MTSLADALKQSGRFHCDQATYKYGKNKDWIHNQLSDLDMVSYNLINETSVGNLLFIYDYADPDDCKKIDDFLSGLLLHYYNSFGEVGDSCTGSS